MTQYSKQALLYFPSTVLFIDDDPLFLSTVGFNLNKHTHFKLCEKPQAALAILQDAPSIHEEIRHIITDLELPDTEVSDGYSLKADVQSLYRTIYNSDRFSYISTVVIDYSMPYFNGADLCGQLRQSPVKKIMLTGEADHQIAVELFNKGLINHFIIKNSPNMQAELQFAIQKAQLAYFEEASASLFDYLMQLPESFRHIDFSKHATHLFKDHSFSEYYVLDGAGSTLFIDADGKATWIIVKSPDDIESYTDIAADQDAPRNIIQLLEDKAALPFFFAASDHQIPAKNWMPYLHTAKQLGDHYYAQIKESDIYDINLGNFLSHSQYLRKHFSGISI